ncbi:MAG: hypothetical protein ACXABY_23225 [Candidatus Thorarchaeota archaeon]|jgi:hypothetical protein
MLTRLGLYGGARPEYGDFSSKSGDGTKGFVSIFTRQSLYGGPRPLYGDFSGKDAGDTKEFTFQWTRHALHGGPRPLYGSFVGKIGGGGIIFNIHARMRSPAAQQRYKTSKAQGIYLNKG